MKPDAHDLIRQVLAERGVRIDEQRYPADLLNLVAALRVATFPEPLARQNAALLKEFRKRARQKVKQLELLLAIYGSEQARCIEITQSKRPFAQSWAQWPDHVGLCNATGRDLPTLLDDLRILLLVNKELVATPDLIRPAGKPTSANVAAGRIVGILRAHGVKPLKAAHVAAELLLRGALNTAVTSEVEKLARSIHASMNDNARARRSRRALPPSTDDLGALLARLKSAARTRQE